MKNKLMFATIVIKLSSLTQCIFPYTEERNREEEERRRREGGKEGREKERAEGCHEKIELAQKIHASSV